MIGVVAALGRELAKDNTIFHNNRREIERRRQIKQGGVDLAGLIAMRARDRAAAMLDGSGVAVDVLITDRQGQVVAEAG